MTHLQTVSHPLIYKIGSDMSTMTHFTAYSNVSMAIVIRQMSL